jgi:putative Holliday junction resolvase
MLLGLDWGERKIGLAIAEQEIAIASALGVIINDATFFDKLKEIIIEYDVDKIIIGKSEHISQSDNSQAIEAFAHKCELNTSLDVVFAQEMFSTREAKDNLKKAGKKNLDSIDDAESARIILQQYLDA